MATQDTTEPKQDVQDVRAQFEALATSNGFYVGCWTPFEKNYVKAETKTAWSAYQAALQSQAVRELVEALKESRRELHACQAVIHLCGGFDTAYVTGAQASLKRTDTALRTLGAGHVE